MLSLPTLESAVDLSWENYISWAAGTTMLVKPVWETQHPCVSLGRFHLWGWFGVCLFYRLSVHVSDRNGGMMIFTTSMGMDDDPSLNVI